VYFYSVVRPIAIDANLYSFMMMFDLVLLRWKAKQQIVMKVVNHLNIQVARQLVITERTMTRTSVL